MAKTRKQRKEEISQKKESNNLQVEQIRERRRQEQRRYRMKMQMENAKLLDNIRTKDKEYQKKRRKVINEELRKDPALLEEKRQKDRERKRKQRARQKQQSKTCSANKNNEIHEDVTQADDSVDTEIYDVDYVESSMREINENEDDQNINI